MNEGFHSKLEAAVGSLEIGCIGTVKLMSCGLSEQEAKDNLANGVAMLIEELQSKLIFLQSKKECVNEQLDNF